jgi:hypothetical protein
MGGASFVIPFVLIIGDGDGGPFARVEESPYPTLCCGQ